MVGRVKHSQPVPKAGKPAGKMTGLGGGLPGTRKKYTQENLKSRSALRTAAENAEWLGEDLAFQRG